MAFILEKKIDDVWYFVGEYSADTIQPLCAAVAQMAEWGFVMYKNLRVRVK